MFILILILILEIPLLYWILINQPHYFLWKKITYKKCKFRDIPDPNVKILGNNFSDVVFNIKYHVESKWGLFKATKSMHLISFLKDTHINYHGMISIFIAAARNNSPEIHKNKDKVKEVIESLLSFIYYPINLKNYNLRQFGLCVLLSIRIGDEKLYKKSMKKFLYTLDCCITKEGWFLEGWDYCKYSDILFDIIYLLDLIDNNSDLYKKCCEMTSLINACFNKIGVVRTDFTTFDSFPNIIKSHYWNHTKLYNKKETKCEVFNLLYSIPNLYLKWDFPVGIFNYWRLTHKKVRRSLEIPNKMEH